MGEKIRLCMEDWLFNSGLVGFYNILAHAGNSITAKENYIEFKSENLLGFEQKYFDYLIDKYKVILSINRIVDFEKTISYHGENDFEGFTSKNLDEVNKYITDVKKYVRSNSYKAAYELIDKSPNPIEIEKKLKVIKLSRNQVLNDIIPEIKNTFKLLIKIINYMKLEESRKYIGAKNVMYTIINNAWNGVSILNSQTKEKDMYKDYKEYFVGPAKIYTEEDKSRYKYNCFSCDRKMKNFSNDLSFLNSIGFDVSRKTSHVWDFQNDVAVCPICKLIYSCVPAGISYLYDKGIFVNDNSSMNNAIRVNNKIYREIFSRDNNEKRLTYKALVESINEEFNDKIKYELADIQVVRLENGSYKFNILSKKSLQVIRESYLDLNKLVNCGFKEINTYFNVYELVIDRLLNNQNLFTLIQKLLHYKLSQPKDTYYNTSQVISMLRVNTRFLRGVGYMRELEKDIVKRGNASGYYLREKYRSKGAIDKLNGISYRLLNSLKTNNTDSLMDTLLNCYLYVKLPVPEVFLDTLRSEEDFKTIGYAFVAGLIEGKKDDENGGKLDEK